MNFETLKKSHLKRNIIIGVIAVLIISAVILNFTKAKYRVTQSIPLVNGTINYTPYDFKMVAMYQENDNGDYVEIEKMPSSGYVINEEKSYCEINGEKDNNAKLATVNGNHTIANLQKGTKCYLYFDEQLLIKNVMLAHYSTVLTRNNFEEPITNTTAGTIYKSKDSTQYDNDGEVYYFAGNPTDNWIYFGGYYWRIIRINGNGSIRIIYSGDSESGPIATNENARIGTSAFNSDYAKNYTVGLKYTKDEQHGQETNSDILNVLINWYSKLSSDVKQYVDLESGFCSDRDTAEGYVWSSNATDSFYYAAYSRYQNATPILKCNVKDILKIPIGLITADEAWYAGGVRTKNNNYYLYSNFDYWTMTPIWSPGGDSSEVFWITTSGSISSPTVSAVNGTRSVRPVINLRANVTITGSGTITDPYELS